jgi:serine O-acetyltransferase
MIGDHVMIGCHTCILGPVSVGDRAKIGAGAVVVSDIPGGATAVGVPAKPLLHPADVTEASGPPQYASATVQTV